MGIAEERSMSPGHSFYKLLEILTSPEHMFYKPLESAMLEDCIVYKLLEFITFQGIVFLSFQKA